MATQTTVTITCDVCGSVKDARTRTITLDGHAVEVDLCAKDGKGLDKVAAKYVPAARKVTTSRRTATTGRRTVSDRERSTDIRSWARTQGFEVSARGRISGEIEEKYDRAH
ncbi:MAG: histone-like nucleoid-structuring protein Lsr2 [Streptosporangiaceae bacterium]